MSEYNNVLYALYSFLIRIVLTISTRYMLP